MGKRYDKRHRLLRNGETARADGYYTYRWTSRDGKRHSVTASTLEELRAKEEEVDRDKSDGIRVDSQNVRVNDMFELWKFLKRGIKDSTFQNYCYMYIQFVEDDIGRLFIKELKRSDVKLEEKLKKQREDWANRLKENGLETKDIQDEQGEG